MPERQTDQTKQSKKIFKRLKMVFGPLVYQHGLNKPSLDSLRIRWTIQETRHNTKCRDPDDKGRIPDPAKRA
jgi:hypothetical protein